MQPENIINTPLIVTRISDLTHRAPQLLNKTTTIREAAQCMKKANTSSVLVTEKGELSGIITEQIFCTKVAADGMDLARPVTDIMTPNPITILSNALGSEALLLMVRYNVHHIPVMENGTVISMITAADLLQEQSHNPIHLVNEIYYADSVEELQKLSQQLPNILHNLVRSNLTSYDIGHLISSIGEMINRQLIKLALEKLGEAPVSYAWIVAGSLSRNEQTAHSDQDNALILSNEYNPDEHGTYFTEMTKFVSDSLNACGYVYCPGDVMATNDRWRQPLSVWQSYFDKWIDTPEPKALMYSSIFFDLRCIHGDSSLLEKAKKKVLEKSPENTLFLSHMAANALHHRPPLGLFRRFILEKNDSEEKALNMKLRGVIPVTDLARVYVLSAGLPALHTQDRLEAAAEAGTLSQSSMEDLRDAFEFIATIRLQHQALQIEQGQTPDNFVPLKELSSLERRQLKEAFKVLTTQQKAMELKYQTNYIA